MADIVDVLGHPAWVAVGSIATTVAVIVALLGITLETRARRRDTEEAQARLVSVWLDQPRLRSDMEFGVSWTAKVLNASELPIYRVVVWQVAPSPITHEDIEANLEERASLIGVLPPGSGEVWIHATERDEAASVELAFNDAAGRHWVRREYGRLERLGDDPADHYGLKEPLEWKVARVNRAGSA